MCRPDLEKKLCPTVRVLKRDYVMTGAMGTGRADGWEHIEGMQVIPCVFYKLPLLLLEYSDHWRAVDAGERKRSYRGMKINADGRQQGFVGPKIIFKPLAKPAEQTVLVL